MSIIKRRKTSSYAQIHNNPLQGDLKDLRAIGLLSHIMSLPESWVLHKTQLQSFYTRKNVDAGWKELSEKNYAIGFNCYKDGKLNYFYQVSDIPFTQGEFDEFVIDQIKELKSKNFVIKNPRPILYSNLKITKKIKAVLSIEQRVSTDAPLVQYSEYSTDGTYINKHKEINTNKEISNIVNKEPVHKDKIIHDLSNEFRIKGLSKNVFLRVLDEVNEKQDIENFGAYLRTCLENTLYKSKLKKNEIDFNKDNSSIYFNWLED